MKTDYGVFREANETICQHSSELKTANKHLIVKHYFQLLAE